jgi:hypothetical protein
MMRVGDPKSKGIMPFAVTRLLIVLVTKGMSETSFLRLGECTGEP